MANYSNEQFGPVIHILKKNRAEISALFFYSCNPDYNNGTIISATMLMILISGFTAGPAVSL
jgi:hypothetical protein